MFPYSEQSPSRPLIGNAGTSITLDVASDLAIPAALIRLGHSHGLRATMPEAGVNEYNNTRTDKDNVRITQQGVAEAKPQSSFMQG